MTDLPFDPGARKRVAAFLAAHAARSADYPSATRPATKRLATVSAPGSDVEHVLTDDDLDEVLRQLADAKDRAEMLAEASAVHRGTIDDLEEALVEAREARDVWLDTAMKLKDRCADAQAGRKAAATELAALKATRPCGRSATHPPHMWMSARRGVQCAGFGECDVAPAVAVEPAPKPAHAPTPNGLLCTCGEPFGHDEPLGDLDV
jgi:hypothetical protein